MNQAQNINWAWAKVYGGTDGEGVSSMTCDGQGNVFITGIYRSPALTFDTITLTNPDLWDELFLAKFDSSGNLIWLRNSTDNINFITSGNIITDQSGNVFLTGGFNCNFICFGSDTIRRNGNNFSSFIIKFDPLGNICWTKSLVCGAQASPNIDLDNNGSILLSGIYYYNLIVDNDTLIYDNGADYWKFFVLKMNDNGDPIWSRKATNTGNSCHSTEVKVDIYGNVYTCGEFNGPYSVFETDTIFNNSSLNRDIYLAKYSNEGNLLWVKNCQVVSEFPNISLDGNGNVIMTGIFLYSITFGTVTLINSGIWSSFIVKFDPDGNPIWAKKINSSEAIEVYDIKTDLHNNSFITGHFDGATATLSPFQLTNINPETSDFFVAKLDSSGNIMWAKRAGGAGSDEAMAVIPDPWGNIYVSGNYVSISFFIGPFSFGNAGDNDIFIAKLEDLTTNIDENTDYMSIKIFPNPGSNKIFLSNPWKEVQSVLIFDNAGCEVLTLKKCNPSNGMDISGLTNGTYYLRIITEKKVYQSKFIKY